MTFSELNVVQLLGVVLRLTQRLHTFPVGCSWVPYSSSYLIHPSSWSLNLPCKMTPVNILTALPTGSEFLMKGINVKTSVIFSLQKNFRNYLSNKLQPTTVCAIWNYCEMSLGSEWLPGTFVIIRCHVLALRASDICWSQCIFHGLQRVIHKT